MTLIQNEKTSLICFFAAERALLKNYMLYSHTQHILLHLELRFKVLFIIVSFSKQTNIDILKFCITQQTPSLGLGQKKIPTSSTVIPRRLVLRSRFGLNFDIEKGGLQHGKVFYYSHKQHILLHLELRFKVLFIIFSFSKWTNIDILKFCITQQTSSLGLG